MDILVSIVSVVTVLGAVLGWVVVMFRAVRRRR